jgi:Protein of unknown function (DUF3015)
MKKVLGVLAAMGMAVTLSSPAQAADLNPWTDCGIGAMVFPTTPVGAVISNVIWDLGSTAVTSNLSSKQTCSGSKAKVALFIGTSYANLADETVQGGGENIASMLNILSCQPAAQAAITQAVRADFAQSLRATDHATLSAQAQAEAYYHLVQTQVTGNFAAQCQSL